MRNLFAIATLRKAAGAGLLMGGLSVFSAGDVRAQDAPPAPPVEDEAAPPAYDGGQPGAMPQGAAAQPGVPAGTEYGCNACECEESSNGLKISGHIQQGYTWNPDSPRDRLNFGRLFDDRSNDYRFNQAIVTFERALDPEPCESDWGFKAQLMYGSDARFIHSLGFMDNITDDTLQPDIVELYGLYHTPGLANGGVDIKFGQFVTLMGAEVIYAPDNYLYSHSYIFNFAIPFKHTGVLATWHLTDQFALHTGLVAGINTGSFFDNNDALAFHGGFGWTSADEALTLNGSFHAGPENDGHFDELAGIDSNNDFRYIASLQAIYASSDNSTWITDLNWGRDEGFDAEWYGVAQYFVYKVDECTTLVVRGEVWRDDDNFAAFKDTSNDGFIDLEHGDEGPAGFGALVGGGDNTYYALTLGINRKVCEDLLVRPEVRWDWADIGSLGVAPYNDNTDNNQFTAGVDVIWSF